MRENNKTATNHRAETRRILRFLLSGGSAAISEYVVFVFLSYVMPLLVANSISFMVGLLISYGMNRTWVFKSTSAKKQEFLRYIGLAGTNLIASNLLIIMFTHIGVESLLAKGLVMGMIAAWNYLIFSRFIFKV